MAELNRAIKDAEHQISHGSLSLKQEKGMMERIRELNKGRAAVSSYGGHHACAHDRRECLEEPTMRE